MGVSNSNNKKSYNEINIIYNIKDKEEISLFGYEFVKNNKNICKMIIDNKEYKIAAEYNVKNYKNNILKIKLNNKNYFQINNLLIFNDFYFLLFK